MDEMIEICPICEEPMGDDSIDGVCEDCYPLRDQGVSFEVTLTVTISFEAAWALRKQKMVPGQPVQRNEELDRALYEQIRESVDDGNYEISSVGDARLDEDADFQDFPDDGIRRCGNCGADYAFPDQIECMECGFKAFP